MIATIFTVIVTLTGIVLSVSLCVLCFRKKNLSSKKNDQVCSYIYKRELSVKIEHTDQLVSCYYRMGIYITSSSEQH